MHPKKIRYVTMRTWYFLLGIIYLMGLFNYVSSQDTDPCGWINIPDSEVMHDEEVKEPIHISQYKIITNINNHYATTVSTTKVTNTVNAKQRYTYFAAIPNNAFLTGFVMDLDGKNYTSYIADNKKSRNQFKSLVPNKSLKSLGSNKTKVVRDSQAFSFSVDLKPNSHSTFYLTYEELLAKKHGTYDDVVNIFPGQLVDDIHVEVAIKESTKISNTEVPFLHSGNEIKNNNEKLESHAFVSSHHEDGVIKSQTILLKMNKTVQIELAHAMKTDENSGFGGQLNIKYDVGNPESLGEIITGNGYFMTSFTPKGLKPITKHVVFVLDTSGSMIGDRIEKLKKAMKKMLNQLHKNDLISLVEFADKVKVWNLDNLKNVPYDRGEDLEKINFPKPHRATSDNIKKAINCVKNFNANYGTDILSSLKVGLQLVALGRKIDKFERQPLIMFLTDGRATVGVTSSERIKAEISENNWGLKKSTISTLSLGSETDQEFLQSLALLNNGLFKHIYDDKDSDLQIRYFFNTISVPVLTDINIQYDPSASINLSDTEFPVYYDGSELIVTGQYDVSKNFSLPKIKATTATGPLDGKFFEIHNTNDNLSHHWAFATTKQLLDKIKINTYNGTEDYKKKVLDVGLEYSFVTPLSSMVFVKPQGKFVVGTNELLQQ